MFRIIIILLLSIPLGLHAQNIGISTKDSLRNKRIAITLEIHDLYSTHNTNFRGGNIIFNYPLSHSFFLGLGTEFSYSDFHNDNTWKLYNLKFWPVFIDSKLNLSKNKQITSFFRVSTGISFVNYKKEDSNTIGKPYNVSENGIYLFSGVGCSYRISKYFEPIIEVGFKGFHMSFDQYDVNPHGVTVRIGLVF